MAIEVSGEFGYVALVVIATFATHMWMGFGVGQARQKYKVNYPAMYAVESENKEAKLFNCVQRGHQNFVEFQPIFLSFLVLGGLQHPVLTAIFGMLYLVSRVIYFVTYSSGEPQKRQTGAVMGFTCLGLLVLCNISFAVHQLLK